MFSFGWAEKLLASSLVIGLTAATPLKSTAAQQRSALPDFSSNFAGWVGLNGGGPFYEPVAGVPSHLSPIVSDPAHPFTPNGTGGQSTYRIPDLSNPNLMPWVKAHMKRDTDEILTGKKAAFSAQSACQPAGVPFFMGYGGPDPIVFLQNPNDVWMVWREDNQARHVFLNVAHSANVKPSWYGESVGHYEGDTLVIDTVGMNDKTVGRHLPHAAHRQAPRGRTLADGRWRAGDGGGLHGRGRGGVLSALDREAALPAGGAGGLREDLRREQRDLFNFPIPVAERPDF